MMNLSGARSVTMMDGGVLVMYKESRLLARHAVALITRSSRLEVMTKDGVDGNNEFEG